MNGWVSKLEVKIYTYTFILWPTYIPHSNIIILHHYFTYVPEVKTEQKNPNRNL
jgi:hypothetical protein